MHGCDIEADASANSSPNAAAYRRAYCGANSAANGGAHCGSYRFTNGSAYCDAIIEAHSCSDGRTDDRSYCQAHCCSLGVAHSCAHSPADPGTDASSLR